MRFQYCKSDSNRFATNLQLKLGKTGKSLCWDSSSGQRAILVMTPFSQSDITYLDDIRKAVEALSSLSVRSLAVNDNVKLFFVTATEQKGFPIDDVAASYRIFPYVVEQNSFLLYEPLDQGMSTSFVNVPQDAVLALWKDVRIKRSLFRTTTEETGFYCLRCVSTLKGYRDGDLYYSVDDVRIPITKAMVNQGVISYIQTPTAPVISSINKGIHIVITADVPD